VDDQNTTTKRKVEEKKTLEKHPSLCKRLSPWKETKALNSNDTKEGVSRIAKEKKTRVLFTIVTKTRGKWRITGI